MSTSPLTSVDLHVPHIPAPHDEGTGRPAAAAASRTVVAASQATRVPFDAKSIANVAPGTGTTDCSARCLANRSAGAVPKTNDSSCTLRAPTAARSGRTVSMYGAGPHTKVSRSQASGAASARISRPIRPRGPVHLSSAASREQCATTRTPGTVASWSSSVRKTMSSGVEALWMRTMSTGSGNWLARSARIIDMIGVVPEPAETKRCLSAGWKLVLKRP